MIKERGNVRFKEDITFEEYAKKKKFKIMEIKKRLSSIIESPSHNTTEKLEKICHLLDQEFDYFNWTGFYFKNGDKEELVLGPLCWCSYRSYCNSFWKGICGQVAVSNETL